MKTKSILLVPLFLLFTLCTKDKSFDVDYFAFGIAHGECIENCAVFFLVQNDNLYADDLNYYSSPLRFKSDPLSTDKYNIAKQLIDDFPQYLKNNPNKTFGCPDCADQGGIHIEIKNNDKTQYWHIDTNINNQPAEIRDYINKMLETLEQLQ